MTQFHAITRARHTGKRWRQPSNYLHVHNDMSVVLGVNELPKALRHFTLALIESEGGFQLIAILAIVPGQNLYLDEAGQWSAGYLPLSYRAFPFRMGKNSEGEQILCINEADGLVADANEGNDFFTGDGSPSVAVKQRMELLRYVDAVLSNTRHVCKLLQQHDLIEPWRIKVQDGAAAVSELDGVYRINEAKLNALPAEPLLELRNSGALLAAYCQLLSMQNMDELGKLAARRAQAVSLKKNLAGFENADIISFENL